jgi:predicted DCC family thiol-disulfide oxidoreductase YuxK
MSEPIEVAAMPPSSIRPRESPATAMPVLLFDGECGLCHRLVRFLLRIDRHGRLRFAPLQGNAAQTYLRMHGLPMTDFDTLIYVPDWRQRDRPDHLFRTAGVVSALRMTGGMIARILAMLLAIFPAQVRDAGYRLVGHWRYRIFGPWRPRPLRRLEWAERFLD